VIGILAIHIVRALLYCFVLYVAVPYISTLLYRTVPVLLLYTVPETFTISIVVFVCNLRGPRLRLPASLILAIPEL
jgi:hypothetical protein